MVDLQRPGDPCKIRTHGKGEQPVPDGIYPGCPGFQLVLPDREEGEADPGLHDIPDRREGCDRDSKNRVVLNELVPGNRRADEQGRGDPVPAAGDRGQHTDRQCLDDDGEPEGDHGKEPFLEPDAGEPDEDPDKCSDCGPKKDGDERGEPATDCDQGRGIRTDAEEGRVAERSLTGEREQVPGRGKDDHDEHQDEEVEYEPVVRKERQGRRDGEGGSEPVSCQFIPPEVHAPSLSLLSE